MSASASMPPNPSAALAALTAVALALPGVAQPDTEAVTLQLSHYQESERELFTAPHSLEPLTVETLRLKGVWALGAPGRLELDFTEDVWSGATPVATAPLVAGGNRPFTANGIIAGASPLLNGSVLLDDALRPLPHDPLTGAVGTADERLVHVMSSASPETRQQFGARLRHEAGAVRWGLNAGFSQEPDYQAGSLGLEGGYEFAQTLTRLQGHLGYAHGAIDATLDHDAAPYLDEAGHALTLREGAEHWQGVREEWTAGLSVTQVLHRDAWLRATGGFSHSRGLLEQPYKAVTVLFVDPAQLGQEVIHADRRALLEQRPDSRDQGSLSLTYVHYIPAHDAALHLDYRYTQDDWGIRSHSLETQWVQPLGGGWTLTPRWRYYSQSAARFYQPYLWTLQNYREPVFDAQGREVWVDGQGATYFRDAQGNLYTHDGRLVDTDAVGARPQTRPFDRTLLPAQFSSDTRLSGFGVLEAGLSLRKTWAKGLSLQADVGYYTHRGALKLGGDGEGDYADFSAWNASLALKLDLEALAEPGIATPHPAHHAPVPAGVAFAHRLSRGRWMLGYHLHTGRQSGALLAEGSSVSDATVVATGCGAVACQWAPERMTMRMQMLELMYAPTDTMTLMLMPQFVTMAMALRPLDGAPTTAVGVHHTHTGAHTTGGMGDTVVAALLRLGQRWQLGLGLSAPTGAVDERFRRVAGVEGGLAHFDMQLGSGSWDLRPSLTYQDQSGDLFWGMQTQGALRLTARNESGYRLGHRLEATFWGGMQLTPRWALTLRGVYAAQGAISGDAATSRIGPMDFPQNYGGRFADLGLGLNATFDRAAFDLAWLQPVWEAGHGVQLERSGTLNFSWSYHF